MSTFHTIGSSAIPEMDTLRTTRSWNRTEGSAPLPRHQLTSLYASIAALGIAALSCAATSSLIAGFASAAVEAAWLQWLAVAVSATWAGVALLFAFASFRNTSLLRANVAVRAGAVAAAVHLAGLMVGIWQLPEATRYFDQTLASLVVLELSVVGVIGWQRNTHWRASAQDNHEPSAWAVVAALFGASILVAAATTVGMASSFAGSLAVPHSGHGESSHNSPLPWNVEQLRNAEHHH